jgi:hypothetical protein
MIDYGSSCRPQREEGDKQPNKVEKDETNPHAFEDELLLVGEKFLEIANNCLGAEIV